jgi:hypothetical protein
LWELDWELKPNQLTDWHDGAKLYLEVFLSLHTPYAATLPDTGTPTEKEIALALTRRGQPRWTDEDFRQLLEHLSGAGYGWLHPKGVRRELEKMAAAWADPPWRTWWRRLGTPFLRRAKALRRDTP